MKKLTRNEVERLIGAGRDIVAILDEMDLIRTHAESEFERLIAELSQPQEEARGILDDAANAAEEYFDERSEKWQEGDAGQVYDEWKNRLRELADAVGEDVEAPQLPEIERPEWVDALGECDFAEFEA